MTLSQLLMKMFIKLQADATFIHTEVTTLDFYET